ncbi:N-acetyltransferase [Mediterraneibacter glycyrrhizinilyticus]|uniref:N-acetyltransferase n=1 Tax=Mediterraneibacter glycyrrhizinilyticus TaxID=342942 RepID=UPI001961E773|nr:N-acetyltransferase [Mediterraneibacter glycyrrhizinilyticus]MBM6752291.1 N-acetyltransferase [Mediterraneibacter glycyrrhizinilyticus]
MKISEISPDTHFVQMNLSEVISQLGEDDAKHILSSFSCPLNLDVENFLKSKAIEFSKRGFSKTHLVYWMTDDGNEKELVGYYTIASKFITIQRSVINYREARKLREHGIFDSKLNEYTVAAPLIAQLGKNFHNGNNTLISGKDLLQMAIDKIKMVQNEVGGRFVYLECEEEQKLIDFYESNNFKLFGKRKLDLDETDIKGKYLLQYFTIL